MDTDKDGSGSKDEQAWLEAARDALVDGAGQVATLWTSYVLALLYFYVATASVTHQNLFLESPIKLPFLSIELPLKGFFWFGPVLVWVLHIYVLIHVRLLADKVNGFGADLKMAYRDPEELQRYLRRLPINLFVQQLAAARLSRSHVTKRLLRAILGLTLVVLPMGLFVFFELQFLPYHHEVITWVQRLLVLGDLMALFYFWPGIAVSGIHLKSQNSRGRFSGCLLPCLSVGIVGAVAALTVFYGGVFPGERLDLLYASRCNDRCQKVLEECGKKDDQLSAQCFDLRESRVQKDKGLFSAVIYLPNFDAVNPMVFDSDSKYDAVQATLSMAGRDLVGAVLNGGNFRKVDFTGAIMSGAQLKRANLRDAALTNAMLDYADLEDAQMPGADLQWADARLANFKGAVLSGANLSGAQLLFSSFDGATMIGTKFIDAKLYGARMRGANLTFGFLAEASLISAHLEGSLLGGAVLDGANLVGAELSNTFLHFASFDGAIVAGAKMDGAALQSSIVKNLHGVCGTEDECKQWEQEFEWNTGRLQNSLQGLGLELVSPVLRAKLVTILAGINSPDSGPFVKSKLAVDAAWRTAESSSETMEDYHRDFGNWLVGMVCNSASDESTVSMVIAGLTIDLLKTHKDIGEMSGRLLSPQCQGTFDLTPFDKSYVAKGVSALGKWIRRCRTEKYASPHHSSWSHECVVFDPPSTGGP